MDRDDLELTVGTVRALDASRQLRARALDVAALAPRLFAVVQDDGKRQWVVAWGMEFNDHAEVATVAGDFRMLLASAASALRYFQGDVGVTTTLVRVDPAEPGGSALP